MMRELFVGAKPEIIKSLYLNLTLKDSRVLAKRRPSTVAL
jgi:hypothetical protein